MQGLCKGAALGLLSSSHWRSEVSLGCPSQKTPCPQDCLLSDVLRAWQSTGAHHGRETAYQRHPAAIPLPQEGGLLFPTTATGKPLTSPMRTKANAAPPNPDPSQPRQLGPGLVETPAGCPWRKKQVPKGPALTFLRLCGPLVVAWRTGRPCPRVAILIAPWDLRFAVPEFGPGSEPLSR